MHDLLLVKLWSLESIVRRNLEKLFSCLKFCNTEIAPYMIGQNSCKLLQKIKVSDNHSEKKFKKLYSSLKFCYTEVALFWTILKIMALDITSRNS